MSNKSNGAFRFLAVAILFFLGLRGVIAADPENSKTEQDLIKLEDQWNVKIEKGDFAFINSIVADDYICTTVSGIVWDKSQLMNYYKNVPRNVTFTNDDYRVKVYGSTAVVTYHYDQHDPGGSIGSMQCRETDVWVKNGSHWQCVAAHSSKIGG